MTYRLIKDNVPSTGASEESLLGKGARNVARLGARAIENVAGLPGSIESLGRGALNLGSSALTGEPAVSSQTFLPTPENIRAIGKQGAGEYLEPQGPIEEFSDELVSDFVPLIAGGVGASRALATAGLGNLAGMATKHITGSKTAGNVVKAGTMIALPFLGINNARKIAGNFYDEAEKLLPADAVVSSKPLQDSLGKIEKVLDKGLTMAPGKAELSAITKELRNKITGSGEINVADLLQSKRDIGPIIEGLGGKSGLKGVAGLAPELSTAIKSTLQGYASKNPKFIESLNKADDIWSGINNSWAITQFLKNHVNAKTLAHPTTALLLGLKPAAQVAKGALGALGLKGALSGIDALWQSKTLRGIYFDVLKSAARENVKALAKDVARLDEVVGKESSSEDQPPRTGKYRLVST